MPDVSTMQANTRLDYVYPCYAATMITSYLAGCGPASNNIFFKERNHSKVII